MMTFPLHLRFKLIAVASQIEVTDAQDGPVFYVKQKAFRLKEAVTVYRDSTQGQVLYRIAADRVIDISAQYAITDGGGSPLGVLQRHGMRSLWRAHYELHQAGRPLFVIREENPWTKVFDSIFGSIPILGLFAGYLFHPAYLVSPPDDEGPVLRVTKEPALFEGRFRIEAVKPLTGSPAELAVVSVLMMLLLERAKG